MLFKIDDSQPPDSLQSHWSEVHYDGHPNSWVPEIPPHWHKHHDEHMLVTRGSVEFTATGKPVILKGGDEMLTIPRMVTHGFKVVKGEATVFKEFTTPPGDFKEAFFEDLLDEGRITLGSALRAAYYGDTHFGLPGGFKVLEQAVTVGFGGLAAWVWPQRHRGMLGESAGKGDGTAVTSSNSASEH